MDRMLTGLAVFAVATSCSQAQAAEFRFEGSYNIYASSGSCTDYDPVGSRGGARFRPELAGSDNGSGASFVFFEYGNYVKGFRLDTGNFDATYKVADNIGLTEEWFTDDNVSVRFASQATTPVTNPPGRITTATTFINIVGMIKNYDFMSGCNVTFRMALQRKVN